ncbi:hypothetical protein [Hymenobacter coccineus]|uniref:hypothetical protein n=1 Tax=Hymenobacter coccineus TaxID=1908235 RepID=UPI001300EF52|nr:hypothetical protein [Hymenobacter coccineus]
MRTAELPLALLLRRDGLAKDGIPRRLNEASAEEKEQLWGRVRRGAGPAHLPTRGALG